MKTRSPGSRAGRLLYVEKASLTCVTSLVIDKHVILSEPGATFITDKRFFTSMDSEMRKQR